MSKVNVSFNKSEYLIDKADLEASASALKNYLLTDMVGSGKTVKFDGVNYNIDATKVAAAVNDFVSYLGTINGTGSKVTLNGVSYNVSTNKLLNSISSVESTLKDLSSAGIVVGVEIELYSATLPPMQYLDDAMGGMIPCIIVDSFVPLAEELQYVVYWDGVRYSSVGQNGEDIMEISGGVCLGDASELGGVGNGEPYGICTLPISQKTIFADFTDTEPEKVHTVRICYETDCDRITNLLPTTVIDANEFNNKMIGGYKSAIISAPNQPLIADSIYFVEWDGITYCCRGVDVSELFGVPPETGMAAIGLGDGAAMGYPGHHEPFIIIGSNQYIGMGMFMDSRTYLEPTTHTVRIYQLGTPSALTKKVIVNKQYFSVFDDHHTGAPITFTEPLETQATYTVKINNKVYRTIADTYKSSTTECLALGFSNEDNSGLALLITDDYQGEGYIKYDAPEGIYSVEVYQGEDLVLIDEQEIEVVSAVIPSGQLVLGPTDFQPGNNYQIIFDGLKYRCKVLSFEGYEDVFVLGNVSIFNGTEDDTGAIIDFEDTGEPFCVVIAGNALTQGIGLVAFKDATAKTHTIGIYESWVSLDHLMPETYIGICSDGSLQANYPVNFNLEVNKEYTVTIDNNKYNCTSFDLGVGLSLPAGEMIGLGNLGELVDGGDKSLPFGITWTTPVVMSAMPTNTLGVSTEGLLAGTTHILSIEEGNTSTEPPTTSEWIVVVPEQNITIAADSAGVYFANLTCTESLILGQRYEIKWNGVTHYATAVNKTATTTFDAPVLFFDDEFILLCGSDGEAGIISNDTGAGNYTIEVGYLTIK